ncbi:hypothetical protein NDR87_08090 [Nocardia sp. CDC159]|uniref:Uncharacterized protein n=1 Tax=Nocardia pulmonis TaxID=2951408 RepID=A0A9X2E5Y1_9NOCA|nr:MULTISPECIES: hypothetical protein [Nocardia]MCM6773430.1 hypothetical protein [Nocardia pulmonis]MCM6786317.1 hypothetical protein [Nocardia sp. CDC159]
MIRPNFRTGDHRPWLPALRAYARRTLARRTLTREERRNMAATQRPAAVFSASLGCHPHI